MSALAEKIEAARARAAAAKAAVGIAASEGAEERELANVEREILDSEALVKAIKDFGIDRIASVETDQGMVIVRRPDSTLYKAFTEKENTSIADVEMFVRKAIVYPVPDRLDVMFREQAAMIGELALIVARLGGKRDAAVLKKV